MADRVDPHQGEVLLDPACVTGGFLTAGRQPSVPVSDLRGHFFTAK
jgi:hypothetical protein